MLYSPPQGIRRRSKDGLSRQAVVPRTMVHELRAGGAGADALTARESQVLGMLRRGKSTAAIAERLQITPLTVRAGTYRSWFGSCASRPVEAAQEHRAGTRATARKRVAHVRRSMAPRTGAAVPVSEVSLHPRRLVYG